MEFFSCIGLFTLRSHWVGEGGPQGRGGQEPRGNRGGRSTGGGRRGGGRPMEGLGENFATLHNVIGKAHRDRNC